MKVAFFLKNSKFSDIDCRHLHDGNPGIGGTHYALLLLVKYLTLYYKDIDVVLFAERNKNLPEEIRVIESDEKELHEKLNKNKIDILVLTKIDKTTVTKRLLNSISENIKIIVWAHCFMPYKDLNLIWKERKIKRLVTVGKEHLLSFCDHPVFRKSSYIYNIFEQGFEESLICQRENIVTYIGSIVPLKGLHLLTKAWPKVIKEIPDAELYIIGTGKLYNQDCQLGDYGIAEYFYEKKILEPILDKDGNIIPSVKFCGLMGAEKKDILNRTKIGVPNPGGKTETFGYTALEFQANGATVITKKCPGYIETVYNPKEFLYEHEDELADYILKYLKINECSNLHEKISEFIKNNFSSQIVTELWYKLLNDVYEGKMISQDFRLETNIKSTIKAIRNKKIRERIGFIPSVSCVESFLLPIKYFLSKIFNLGDTVRKIWRRKMVPIVYNNKFNKN